MDAEPFPSVEFLDKSLPCRLITLTLPLLKIEGLGVNGPVGQLGFQHFVKLGHRVGMDDMGDLFLLHGHSVHGGRDKGGRNRINNHK